MNTKIVRLSGSTWAKNQVVPDPKKGSKWLKKLCANRVLYGCQAGSKKDFKGFYLGFMRDLKLFRVYGLKRVLNRSYPALRRVLYVHNRVLYGTAHCYTRPFQTRKAHLTKFVNLCPRQDPLRPCYTPILSMQEISNRTTVDPFRHPERTIQFINLCPSYNPFRSCQTLIPSFQEISDRPTLDPFKHPKCTLEDIYYRKEA